VREKSEKSEGRMCRVNKCVGVCVFDAHATHLSLEMEVKIKTVESPTWMSAMMAVTVSYYQHPSASASYHPPGDAHLDERDDGTYT
jgi:hypothetical protein